MVNVHLGSLHHSHASNLRGYTEDVEKPIGLRFFQGVERKVAVRVLIMVCGG